MFKLKIGLLWLDGDNKLMQLCMVVTKSCNFVSIFANTFEKKKVVCFIS